MTEDRSTPPEPERHPSAAETRQARRERRRQRVYAAYATAATDAAFLADLAAITLSFDAAVGDGLGGDDAP